MPALSASSPGAMLAPMPDAPTSSLLEWFAQHQPEHTHRAGSLVFVDLAAIGPVIDRAEAAGMSIQQARGFAVVDDLARPVQGQQLDPAADALLDCETPSGSTCGAARRALRGVWAANPPSVGRHMVLLTFDEGPSSHDGAA